MKQLTKVEEQIMQALWKVQKGNVASIIEKLPNPKPHYNTVSTIVKILVEKNFVNYDAIGRSYFYFPLISKDDYAKQTAKQLMKNYFKGGISEMISFFVKEKDVSLNELEEILKEIKNQKSK